MENWQTVLSVYPPTKYLTFGVWIYLVPQYKPKNVLVLGYADGTVAGLIKLLYGDIPITGVDIVLPEENRYNVELVKDDAFEYVKNCGKYDCVIVDCFNGDDDSNPCGFISTKEFADNLTRITNYVIINTLKEPDLSAYNHLKLIGINKPSGLANKVYYFEVNKIPDLHPYK